MKFVKMHGAGNDYIYVDARNMDKDWPLLAQKMSNRHFGIGGDGLILLHSSSVADIRMQMFNVDGSEGEMCGNGIRCLVKFALDRNLIGLFTDGGSSPVTNGNNVSQNVVRVETLAGTLRVHPIFQDGKVIAARVAMGCPIIKPSDIPVKLDNANPKISNDGPIIDYPCQVNDTVINLTFISMGNPHAIAFIKQDINEFPLEILGPMIENHELFPNRINFEIVNVGDRNRLNMRVWERGSGETLACGSGAAAVTVAAHLRGLVENEVNIKLPGGILKTQWDGEGDVYLEGPAKEVFEGEWVEN